MSLEQYRAKNILRGDSALLFIILGLGLFGLLVISSASVVVSYELFGSNNVFLTKQSIYFALGMVGMVLTSWIDYRVWRHFARTLLLISLILVILVEIPGIGVSLGGAQRWINLGPILLQPSEIIKISFCIYAAAWLEKKGDKIKSFKEGLLPFLGLVSVIALIIIKQPDLGTGLVILAISVAMLFIAGVSLQHFFLTGVSGLAIIYLFIRTESYRWERFLTFLNPGNDLQGAGYQINQAGLAIGTGGLFGVGFGQSLQKYLYLPQVQTDAIFAVMVEELGFIRVFLIIVAFVLLGLKGYTIAKNAPDAFSRYLATGITTWILFQAFVNMGGIMGVIPLTGIPLPFISYGGSSLIALLSACGILYNISRHAVGTK